MFFDARSLDVTVLETDVCIVGAGAAGITVACQLANTSISVLLLESGGFELDADTQSLAQGENVSFEDFPLEATRLRFFGGTTNHWAGVTYRMDAADLAARPDMPLSGWPITYDELVKYYPAAERLCHSAGRNGVRSIGGSARLVTIHCAWRAVLWSRVFSFAAPRPALV